MKKIFTNLFRLKTNITNKIWTFMGLSWTFVFLVSVIGFIIIPRTFVLLNFSLIHKFKEQIYAIIKEKSPLAALLLIPVTIISGAYWTSIPFYLVIATLWLFQRKSSIPWEAGISLMGSCLLAIFIVSKTDYAYWIYTIKIIGCFVIVVSLRPAIQNQHRFWIDIFFVFVLWIIWETNSYFHLGRWTFDFGNRFHPNWTAVYCFLFAMLAVRWRMPLALLTA